MRLSTNFVLVLILQAFIILSCQREVVSTSDQQSRFVKTFDGLDDEGGLSIQTLPDGDIVIFGTRLETDQLQVIRTDRYGNEILRRTYPSNFDALYPQSLLLPDGTVIVTSRYSSDFYHFDKKLNLISHTSFYPYYDGFVSFSKPVLGDDGTILISTTGGFGTISDNVIHVVDQDGEWLTGWNIWNASLGGGRCTQFNVVKGDSMGASFVGTKYPDDNWLYGDNVIPFTYSFEVDSTWRDRFELFDLGDLEDSDVISAYDIDEQFAPVIVTAHRSSRLNTDISNLTQQCEIHRFTKDGERLWKRKLRIDNVRSIQATSIQILENNELIVAGFCLTNKNFIDQGFVVHLNATGNFISQKVYDFTGSSQILDIAVTPLSDVIMTGTSSTFGKGLLGKDVLLMRTDFDGEYE